MLLKFIFETQIQKKIVDVNWTIFMNTDIILTTEEIKLFFGILFDKFQEKFKSENGLYKVSAKDAPKIQEIDSVRFQHIKSAFIISLRDQNLGLKHFYDLLKVGIQLLKVSISELFWKSKSTKEKESFFQLQLSEFFFDTFPKSEISFQAYLKGKKHSDCIMFEKTSYNYENLVFIEYASDIQIGKPEDQDGTIFGHLNRISNEYFQEKISFFHGTEKISKKTLDHYSSKVWFIYFEENLHSSIIKTITENFFESINILLIDYNFFQSKHMIIHYKKHDKKEFIIEKLY